MLNEYFGYLFRFSSFSLGRKLSRASRLLRQAEPPRSCDRLDDDHMTAVVRRGAPPHLRWTTVVMWSSSRRSHDIGGLASRPDEASEMPVKACDQAKKNWLWNENIQDLTRLLSKQHLRWQQTRKLLTYQESTCTILFSPHPYNNIVV